MVINAIASRNLMKYWSDRGRIPLDCMPYRVHDYDREALIEQKRQTFSSVDEYIASFPADVQEILI